MLDGRAQFVYVFWIRYSNLEIWALLIALKAEQALPKDHLYGVYRRFVLCKLGLEVCFVPINILSLKVDRCCDIEVVEEVGHMQEYRVTSLRRVSVSQ